MNLNEKIYSLRKEREWTQEQLAQKLGVSYQAVSKWENAQACPDIGLLPEIADLFGVSIDALFGREADSSEAQKEADAPGELPWEEDGALHLAVFEGRRLMGERRLRELVGQREAASIRLEGEARDVYCMLNLSCEESIQGNVQAGGSVRCDEVYGSVTACSVACGDVSGSVTVKGGSVQCGDVDGSVNADGTVSCSDVNGSVNAGGSAQCGDVNDSVNAGGEVHCGDVGGDVKAGGEVHCGDVSGGVSTTNGSVHWNREDEDEDEDGEHTVHITLGRAAKQEGTVQSTIRERMQRMRRQWMGSNGKRIVLDWEETKSEDEEDSGAEASEEE